MNEVVVANDLPDFLLTAIKRFRYDNLNYFQKGALKVAISIRANTLPKKNSDYNAYYVQSFFEQEIVDSVNEIDFKKMTTQQLHIFQQEITKATGGQQ